MLGLELKSNEVLAASPGEVGARPPPLWFSDALRTDKTSLETGEHPGPTAGIVFCCVATTTA